MIAAAQASAKSTHESDNHHNANADILERQKQEIDAFMRKLVRENTEPQ